MVVAGTLRVVALAVMMVTMLVFVVMAGCIVVVVMVLVLPVLVMVVMVMVMMMLVLLVVIIVMVMMVVLFLLGLMLGPDALHQLVRQGHLLHSGQNGLAVQLVPGGSDDGGIPVLLPQQGHGSLQLLGADLLGAAENDGSGGFDLVVVKLAEVLHVYLYLRDIRHGDKAVQLHLRHILHGVLHRQDHIGQLPHARGLNEDAIRGELCLHILQGLVEVAHQGAADAPGGHLADLHPGILQKTAIDADLPEFIFNEYQLLTLIGLRQHLLNERGFPCAQKAGHNINLSHKSCFLSDFYM